MFDYYYGSEAEQFAFYRIPKILFEAEGVRDISTDAKLLYGLMLDRMQLSAKNNWVDEEGRVYIYFSIKQIMEAMGCASQKATKLLDELEESAGLIERERTGLNKPNRIYVKNFISVFRKSKFRNGDYQNSGVLKIENQEVRKSKSNNTDINKTDINNTESIISIRRDGSDAMDEYAIYERMIKENIDYDYLIQDFPYDRESIDEIVTLMADTVTSHHGTIRISGDDKPIEVVKNRFLKLQKTHIEYVLQGLKDNPVQIRNIRAYLLASLFNAPTTISNYYSAMVNHDMSIGLV